MTDRKTLDNIATEAYATTLCYVFNNAKTLFCDDYAEEVFYILSRVNFLLEDEAHKFDACTRMSEGELNE